MVVLMCLETLVDLLSPDFSSFGASDLSILFCWPQAQWHKQMSVQLQKNGCFPSKSYVCDTLNKNNNNGIVESSLRFDAVVVEFILEVLPLILLSIHHPRAVFQILLKRQPSSLLKLMRCFIITRDSHNPLVVMLLARVHTRGRTFSSSKGTSSLGLVPDEELVP